LDEVSRFAASTVNIRTMKRSSVNANRRARIPAASLAMWLCATCLIAATPLFYFATGGSDSATEATRIEYSAPPLLAAWGPLAISFGLIRRRQTGRWGLPFGLAGRRAALVIAVAAVMLAAMRALGTHSTIYGDTAWAVVWLACFLAWTALGWASARRLGPPA
jgi:hypothetical protein